MSAPNFNEDEPNFNEDEVIFLADFDDLAPWIAKEFGVTLTTAEKLAREVIKEATKQGQWGRRRNAKRGA